MLDTNAIAGELRGRVSIEDLRSQDPQMYKDLFEDNVLGATREDMRSKSVLDVGAYMGFFSVLAAGLGAERCVAVESNPRNFRKLRENVAPLGNVTAIHGAVFDGRHSWLGAVEDLGVSKVVPGETNDRVPAVSLGDLLPLFPPGENLVLKVDTEGAEYDILLNASGREIRRFDTIFLETHQTPHLEGKPARKAQFLKDYLDLVGFDVVYQKHVHTWQEDDKGGYEWYERIENQEGMKLKRRPGPTG